jgi:hypothetical protein
MWETLGKTGEFIEVEAWYSGGLETIGKTLSSASNASKMMKATYSR